MMRRLKSSGFGHAELGMLLVGVLLALGAVAIFGAIRQVSTNHTERVEKHVTTTERVPVRSTVSERRMREIRVVVRRQVAASVAKQIRAYCSDHVCRRGEPGKNGEDGERGLQGPPGHDGAPGVDGSDSLAVRPAPKHQLDSSILDGVDNRVHDVEGLVRGLLGNITDLTSRVAVLEKILGPVCRLLRLAC